MRRFLAALGAACWLMVAVTEARAQATPGPTAATQWNDPRSMEMARLATARRAQQLADTGLVDYQAVAHGYLTFLAQMGEGFTEPPKIVKADELALEVYWKAPNLSKQRIVGRRDTLLLPTDVQYHRDHLGIVQNNFPDIIRLGDGDEVRDVPHPLSARGLEAYDFAIRDSLRIVIPGSAIDVYEVRVRPRDDRQARVIGSLFIERTSGQVVRMAFGFTRAAFLDKQLEDLSIVLENRLVGTRFWLPSRQEIEIRRSGTWLDYPVRGIIRGRWEIGEYQLNKGFQLQAFAGPEIVQAPRQEQQRYQWQGRILDSLPPDVRAVTNEDVARVHAEARELVRAQALQRARTSSLALRGVSDFVRVNRAEGLSLGAGVTQRFGGGVSLAVRGRYGLDDREAKGEIALQWQQASGRGLRLFAMRDFRSAGDEQERSSVVNSLAAQEFGSDYTDPYDVYSAGATLSLGRLAGALWHVDAGIEGHDALAQQGRSATGRYQATLPAATFAASAFGLRAEVPTRLAWLGTEVAARAELRSLTPISVCTDGDGRRCYSGSTVPRASLLLQIERPVSRSRLVSRTSAVAVYGDAVPVQLLAFLGGPVSGPGYDYHQIAATAGVSQRLEWRFPVPFAPVPLGRFGRAPASATLAPFVHGVLANEVPSFTRTSGQATPPSGVVRGAGTWRAYPSVGVGLLTVFDVLRFDVARGLRDGRWSFYVDVSRELWRIL